MRVQILCWILTPTPRLCSIFTLRTLLVQVLLAWSKRCISHWPFLELGIQNRGGVVVWQTSPSTFQALDRGSCLSFQTWSKYIKIPFSSCSGDFFVPLFLGGSAGPWNCSDGSACWSELCGDVAPALWKHQLLQFRTHSHWWYRPEPWQIVTIWIHYDTSRDISSTHKTHFPKLRSKTSKDVLEIQEFYQQHRFPANHSGCFTPSALLLNWIELVFFVETTFQLRHSLGHIGLSGATNPSFWLWYLYGKFPMFVP